MDDKLDSIDKDDALFESSPKDPEQAFLLLEKHFRAEREVRIARAQSAHRSGYYSKAINKWQLKLYDLQMDHRLDRLRGKSVGLYFFRQV